MIEAIKNRKNGITAVLLITVGVVTMVAGINFLTKKGCLDGYDAYQPSYGFFSGCRIMWHGVLTPTDIVRTINTN